MEQPWCHAVRLRKLFATTPHHNHLDAIQPKLRQWHFLGATFLVNAAVHTGPGRILGAR